MSYRPGEAAFDRWSWVHVASGVALGLLVASVLLVLALLVAYEAFEAGLRRVNRDENGRGLFEYESWPNIGADILVGLGGFAAARLALWAAAGTPTVL